MKWKTKAWLLIASISIVVCLPCIAQNGTLKDTVLIVSKTILKRQLDTMNIIRINLEVLYNDKILRGAKINLHRENQVIQTFEDTSMHQYTFKLQRNQYYTIEISKPGLVTRLIAVDTRLPNDFVYEHSFDHDVMVSLFNELEQVKGLDTYYLDFPIGIIYYNDDQDELMFRKKYTRHIKKHVERARLFSEVNSKKNN